MKGLRDVEYLPEPTDRSIVSAVDPTVIGFQNEWRSEIMGWAPQEVTPVVRPKRRTFTVSGMVVFALLVSASLLFWQNNWIVVEFQVPKSEWAFEDSELRTLQQEGLTGQDVRVCMVDTGIDATHEAFGGREIEFKDLVGSSRAPLDYGAVAHGTLMAGLLLSTDHQEGAAPGVTFAMVASLSDNGDGENTGLIQTLLTPFDGANLSLKRISSRFPSEAARTQIHKRVVPLLPPVRPPMLASTSSQQQVMTEQTMMVMLRLPAVFSWRSRSGQQHKARPSGPIRPLVLPWTETESPVSRPISNPRWSHLGSSSSARGTITDGTPAVEPRMQPCSLRVHWPLFSKAIRC